MKRYSRVSLAAAILFLSLGSLLAAENAKDDAIKQERMKFELLSNVVYEEIHQAAA